MTRKKMKKSSETSPTAPTSLSSLPDDIIVNCLARISRFHYPTLSLVSKCFRSLLASPELEATRSFIGITENYLCVCLNLYNNNYNPRWFTLSPIPKQRLKPVPWLWHRHQYPKSSTVVSNGSEIYIVGGLVSETGSKRVLVFDCRSRQWRSLPDMRQPRVSTAVDVVDSKLYVTGGYEPDNIEDWGEVYDPKTQTWEPILPTALDLTIQKSVVPGCLVMGGKLYTTNGWKMNICYVEIENLLLGQTSDFNRDLIWRDPKEDGFKWTRVKGLKQVLWKNITYVGNSPGGRRVTVWWTSVVKLFRHYWTEEFKTEVWCAEISFERRGSRELWGFVEWSKNVFTFKGCDSPSNLVLDYAIVTY